MNSLWVRKEGYSKKILLTEGDVRIQIAKSKKGDTVKPHHHKKQTEYFYILSGSARIVIGGKIYNAKPGDVLVCIPNQVHSLEAISDIETPVFKTDWEEGDSYRV